MGSQKYFKVLYDSSDAGDGQWFALDSKFESSGGFRTIHGTCVSGDTIEILGTTKPDLTNIQESDVTTIDSFGEDFEGSLIGSYQFIKIRKVGTTGRSRVLGCI